MPDLLAEVNARVYELAERADLGPEKWEFVCECGRPPCRERVRLTPTEFEDLKHSGGAVLAPGHRLSPTHRAIALREEGLALRAQARLQVLRALRNLRAAAGRPE